MIQKLEYQPVLRMMHNPDMICNFISLKGKQFYYNPSG
jgi:hypothetical protein